MFSANYGTLQNWKHFPVFPQFPRKLAATNKTDCVDINYNDFYSTPSSLYTMAENKVPVKSKEELQ